MDDSQEPSQELLTARRALEGMPGVLLLKDWVWNEIVSKWVLHCRLHPDISPDGLIPATTEWFVLVDPAYPWGTIKFYPAKKQGLTLTFSHQSYNSEGNDNIPWRTGTICLDTTVRVLGRQSYDIEPYEIHERLRWHFQRALEWLTRASRDELVVFGEPFELPQFPKITANPIIAFSEDKISFDSWENITEQAGLVKLLPLPGNPKVLVVKCFQLITRNKKIIIPSWGQALESTKNKELIGIWLRLKNTPVLQPWQAPTTWGELRKVCHLQGVSIDNLLKMIVRFIRDGEKHVALIGFPVSEKVGDTPCQVHWQAIQLPVLSHGAQVAKGFRPNEQGYWRRDYTEILHNERLLDWLPSENWHLKQTTARGSFTQKLGSKRFFVIGVGAVGSVISELLIRNGVQKLLIADGDQLQVGNLVRHTLLLSDIGKFKAESITKRLRLASPYATIETFPTDFPPDKKLENLLLQQSEVIFDCTGADEILHHLAAFPWNEKKLFVSISLGFQARRLYCYTAYSDTFPHTHFRKTLNSWLKQELKMYEGQEFPREGIGCWHPVFPARIDDIWLMAPIAIKYIEPLILAPPVQPKLSVFEQQYDKNGSFIGVHKLQTEANYV